MWEESLISQHVSHPWWGGRCLWRPTVPFEWQDIARVRILGQTTRSLGRGRKYPENEGCLPPERSLRQPARQPLYQRGVGRGP